MADKDEVVDLPVDRVRSLRALVGSDVLVTVPASVVGVGTKAVTFEVNQAFDKPVRFSVNEFEYALVVNEFEVALVSVPKA